MDTHTLFHVLQVIGFVAICGAVYVFAQTNLYLTLMRWLWSTVLLLAGAYTSWRMIVSIDFDAPVLLSIRWSTLGLLFLTAIFWFMAWAMFRTKVEYEDGPS